GVAVGGGGAGGVGAGEGFTGADGVEDEDIEVVECLELGSVDVGVPGVGEDVGDEVGEVDDLDVVLGVVGDDPIQRVLDVGAALLLEHEEVGCGGDALVVAAPLVRICGDDAGDTGAVAVVVEDVGVVV